ncbi:MAG: hypothetical protein ACPG4T_23385 [Nannocystaceae bacterium]
MSVDRRSLLMGAAGVFAGFRIHPERHELPDKGACRLWVVYEGGHCSGRSSERDSEFTWRLIDRAREAGMRLWDRQHDVRELSRVLCSIDAPEAVAAELEAQALKGQGKLSDVGGVVALWVEVGDQ